MKSYAYNADLYCEDCARDIIAALADIGITDDGTTDTWPQPQRGERDYPSACGNCGEFLEIPLTEAGAGYVVARVIDHLVLPGGNPAVLAQWWGFYEDSIKDAWTSDDTEAMRYAVGALLEREAND